MKIHKLAVAGLAAGLMLAAVGVAQNSWANIDRAESSAGAQSPAATSSQTSVSELEPVHGLAPISDVISLWRERSAGQPLDYLNRTQLGSALATQARENADLAGYEEAESVLREALSVNPSYPPARLALASTLQAQHRFVEARSLAVGVHADKPSAAALALIGDSNFELGDYDAAAKAYDELRALERTAPVISREARLASVRGDNQGAVTLAAEALAASQRLALRPNASAFYYFQLGHFRFESGDVSGAIADLEQALGTDPGSAAASEKLAFVYASTGRVDEALALYLELIESGPAPDLYGSAADLYVTLGNSSAAVTHELAGVALAEETIDRFPAERRHLVGFLLDRDPQLALGLAEADLLERQDVGAYDTMAWALHRNGRHEEAAEMIELALAHGTRQASILYHAGAIAAANGSNQVAIDHLEMALSVNAKFHPTEAVDAVELLARLR